jgi:hypothetical protein
MGWRISRCSGHGWEQVDARERMIGMIVDTTCWTFFEAVWLNPNISLHGQCVHKWYRKTRMFPRYCKTQNICVIFISQILHLDHLEINGNLSLISLSYGIYWKNVAFCCIRPKKSCGSGNPPDPVFLVPKKILFTKIPLHFHCLLSNYLFLTMKNPEINIKSKRPSKCFRTKLWNIMVRKFLGLAVFDIIFLLFSLKTHFLDVIIGLNWQTVCDLLK